MSNNPDRSKKVLNGLRNKGIKKHFYTGSSLGPRLTYLLPKVDMTIRITNQLRIEKKIPDKNYDKIKKIFSDLLLVCDEWIENSTAGITAGNRKKAYKLMYDAISTNGTKMFLTTQDGINYYHAFIQVDKICRILTICTLQGFLTENNLNKRIDTISDNLDLIDKYQLKTRKVLGNGRTKRY